VSGFRLQGTKKDRRQKTGDRYWILDAKRQEAEEDKNWILDSRCWIAQLGIKELGDVQHKVLVYDI